MSELKLINCPFCDGKAEFVKMGIVKDIPLGFIRCTECGVRLRQENCTEDFAKDEWNRRTPMSNIVEKLEKLPYGRSYHDYAEKGIVHKYLERNDVLDIVKQEINNGLE